MKLRAIVFLLASLQLSLGDIYLQNPRGSNNRLNEQTTARKNANRLFDSQNNNKGGYNVGDATSAASNGNEALQYQMKYFQSSFDADTLLAIEWTMQHGCGQNIDPRLGRSEINCNVIIQYMCQDTAENEKSIKRMRDGTSTNTQDFTASTVNANQYIQNAINRAKNNIKADRGLHESWSNYESCRIRERNQGLFTADRNLGTNGVYSSAIYTRQNEGGTRRGYECPEERDYYPYWHPNPWKDIAALVTNVYDCRRMVKTSFNVQPKHRCVEFDNQKRQIPSRWNNEESCRTNGGLWLLFYNYLEKAPEFKTAEQCKYQTRAKGLRFIWEVPHDSITLMPECLVALKAPDCRIAPWSRANHLGNSDDARSPYYVWKLPYFPSEKKQTCVLRVRYNISSYDYDSMRTDYKSNQNNKENNKSPVTNNPTITLENKVSLQLTINTAQLGRTFQDRSHVFHLLPRPWELKKQRIHNLNVRGKRGNIVQTFPATEYDFAPTTVYMNPRDLLHIQWTGSNTHNNNNDGADGVGAAGTDRNNIVEIPNLGVNYPLPYEYSSLWQNIKIKWISFNKIISPQTLAVNLASSGYYRCMNSTECPEAENQQYLVATKAKISNVLDNAPASYEGVILEIRVGRYYIMCTRNNNFSNRSQKGTIIVK